MLTVVTIDRIVPIPVNRVVRAISASDSKNCTKIAEGSGSKLALLSCIYDEEVTNVKLVFATYCSATEDEILTDDRNR